MSTSSKETKKSAQLGETSPTVAAVSPSQCFEKLAKASISSDSPTHITIDNESMKVDSTNVLADRTKDPFKDFGPNNVGNIVDYNISTDKDKEKEQEKKKEDVSSEKKFEDISTNTKVSTMSEPITTMRVKSPILPTQAIVVTTTTLKNKTLYLL